LHSEVGKAIKEMRGEKKATGDDVPGGVTKQFGIMTQLINNTNDTGQ
jgi:hypothetical protein